MMKIDGDPTVTIKRGITREVLLLFGYAIKLPSFRSWFLFLEGLQCNINESARQHYSKHFCPVLFSTVGGFFNVMPRCERVEITEDEYDEFLRLNPMHSCVEKKDCSFGILNNKLVAVDYG